VNPLELALRRIASDLAAAGRKWAVIGGLAVSARAEPRTTRDVDLAVAVTDDADTEALVFTLLSCGYKVLAALEQTAVGRLSTTRLSTPGAGPNGVVVDLLFASSGIEPEIVEAAEVLEILPGLRVPVARIGHLIALKVLARDDRRRPQDWDDIRALLAEASPVDVEEARDALALIARRGYHRERQLVEQLEQIIRERDDDLRDGP
jgi:predicted nucleotidyltransferase